MNESKNGQLDAQRLYIVDRESWWLVLVAGIITLILGILIVSWPEISTKVLVLIFGISILLISIVAVIRSFTLIKQTKTWWVLLIEGIAGIIIAIVLFTWPVQTTAVIAYFIGIWLVIIGILAIIFGAVQKSFWPILNGILSLVVGFIVLFTSPSAALATLVFVFGIVSIFRGIIMIIQSIIIKKAGAIVVTVENKN